MPPNISSHPSNNRVQNRFCLRATQNSGIESQGWGSHAANVSRLQSDHFAKLPCNVPSCFICDTEALTFHSLSFSDPGSSIRIRCSPVSASLKAAHCSLFRSSHFAPAAYICLGQWAQHTSIPNNSSGKTFRKTCPENMGNMCSFCSIE